MSKKQQQFVSTETSEILAKLTAAYEAVMGVTVRPASPESLFIHWTANLIMQERVIINYAGNQNIPSGAEGKNLDALGELFYLKKRPTATAATCTERFCISEVQPTAVLIPAGTRVTDKQAVLVWETTDDVYVSVGETSADVRIRCKSPGASGNGYAERQISEAVDVFPYYERCENITESGGGADAATDEEYYALMRDSEDAYSTAGPAGSYVYHAQRASLEIADVIVNSPSPGVVALYVLMKGGELANEETKAAVLAACNDSKVRPLTELVQVGDVDTVEYDIDLTYYIAQNTDKQAADIERAVDAAIADYVTWQSAKLGRDINPSYLHGLLMQTGIKRVEVRAPSFLRLRDGAIFAAPEDSVPQIAKLSSRIVLSGGYEDE